MKKLFTILTTVIVFFWLLIAILIVGPSVVLSGGITNDRYTIPPPQSGTITYQDGSTAIYQISPQGNVSIIGGDYQGGNNYNDNSNDNGQLEYLIREQAAQVMDADSVNMLFPPD